MNFNICLIFNSFDVTRTFTAKKCDKHCQLGGHSTCIYMIGFGVNGIILAMANSDGQVILDSIIL